MVCNTGATVEGEWCDIQGARVIRGMMCNAGVKWNGCTGAT